jgi:uncharacterized DUF497 family protein
LAAIVYEWDEDKRLANLRKHGVDFTAVEDFAWEYSITFEDTRERYAEQRWVAVGPLGSALHVVVFTEPEDGVTRIISMRRATKQEARQYAKEVLKTYH